MRSLRQFFIRSRIGSRTADARLDAITFYSALSFIALIVVVTLPYRPF